MAVSDFDFRIFEATPGVSVIVHVDAPVFTYAAISDDFLRATGMRREEVLGKGYFDVFPSRSQDPDFSGEENIRASFLEVIRTGRPRELPEQRFAIRDSDGAFSERYRRIKQVPVLDEGGQVVLIIHSAVDVADIAADRRNTDALDTEGAKAGRSAASTDVPDVRNIREQLEYGNMLFQTMTDNATSALFMMDQNGYCTFMNKGGERMFGYSQREIREKPLHYLIHHHRPDGSFYPMHECPLDRALPDNFDLRAHRDLFFRKDGSSLPVSCAASPIFEEGVPVSTVIEVRDISTELEAEETLRRSAQELENLVQLRTSELNVLNEQLKQFAYAASHDLQEPLRKIAFFTERLAAAVAGDATAAPLIERITATVRRMRSIINDILDYSNVTMGSMDFQEVALDELVQEVLGDLELTLSEKGALVEVAPLPVIWGDPRQLRQLFHNLIGNALKYHRPGEPPVVRIGIKTSDVAGSAGDRFCEVMVADKGIGFEPDYAEKIFQVFQRLHGRSEYPGTGVGLSIVRKVAESHGGVAWAESEPGRGATFYVRLRLSPAAAAPL